MHDAVSAMGRGEKFQARKAAAAGFGAAIRVHLAWAEPDALAASHRGDEKPPPLSHFPHAPQIGLRRSRTAVTLPRFSSPQPRLYSEAKGSWYGIASSITRRQSSTRIHDL